MNGQFDRCTHRKHVIENGDRFCDCGAMLIGPTAAKNAQVVTVISLRAQHALAEDAREVARG